MGSVKILAKNPENNDFKLSALVDNFYVHNFVGSVQNHWEYSGITVVNGNNCKIK